MKTLCIVLLALLGTGLGVRAGTLGPMTYANNTLLDARAGSILLVADRENNEVTLRFKVE